jgi:hypothetical protein
MTKYQRRSGPILPHRPNIGFSSSSVIRGCPETTVSGIQNREHSHAYNLTLTIHKVLGFLGSLYSAPSGLGSRRLKGPTSSVRH